MCHCVFWYIMSVHRAAALCLAKALLKCPVPKSVTFPSRWECAGFTDGYTSANLKEKIVAWLLMMDQSDEVEESCRPHPIICRLALCFYLNMMAIHSANIALKVRDITESIVPPLSQMLFQHDSLQDDSCSFFVNK